MAWCKDSFVELNVSKTKKMVIDFSKSAAIPKAPVMMEPEVELVDNYK